MSKKFFLGVDDGYAETKIVMQDGQSFKIPSIAKAGLMNQISLSGSETTVFPYQTNDGNYITGEILEADPTAFDEFPISALNRVIVSHAIRSAGIPAGSEVIICTGLPVKKFYVAGNLNKDFIKKKKQNLLKNDVVPLNGGILPKIIKHDVVSEGIAAWMDIVMQRDEAGKLKINQKIRQQRIAIIDIGGRTTDIAVIHNGNLDISRSSTINVGMLAVKESVKERLSEKFSVSLSIEQVDQAIKLKKIKLFGEWEAVEDIVNSSEQTVASRIEAECKRCLNNSSDLDKIVFVGGTVMAIEQYLKGWFRQQSIGDDPAFANARGMQKFAEYSMMAK